MANFGEDSGNPFARPSPWPNIPPAPMRLTLPHRAAPAQPEPAPEPEPVADPMRSEPPAPAPRFIVLDTPVFGRTPPAAAAVQAPMDLAPAPDPREPEPAVHEEAAPAESLERAATPLAQPILRPRRRRAAPTWSPLRLAPLAGAAVAGAGAVFVLFLLMGRQSAQSPPIAVARGLAPGQMVASGPPPPVATATTAAVASSPSTRPPTTPAPRLAMALARPDARVAAPRLDVPAMAPAATAPSAPARELAAPVLPPPPLPAAPTPAAPAFTPPAPPPADAPFRRHDPDPE